MNRHVIAWLSLSLVFLTACGGRVRVRLSEVETTRTTGNNTAIEQYQASYAKDGTLDEVEVKTNGQLTLRMQLAYDEGRLAELDVENGDGSRALLELVWEDGWLVELDGSDGDGNRWSTAIEYVKDAPGKVERTEFSRDLAANTSIARTTDYRYDDAGRLDETEASTVLKLFDFESESSTRLERSYGDSGELEKVNRFETSGDNTNAKVYEYGYEEGRLVELEEQAGQRFEVVYDDAGRIRDIDVSGDGQTSQTELVYEDGSVEGGIVFTPPLLPNAIQFDLQGRSFPDVELLTFDFLLGGL